MYNLNMAESREAKMKLMCSGSFQVSLVFKSLYIKGEMKGMWSKLNVRGTLTCENNAKKSEEWSEASE